MVSLPLTEPARAEEAKKQLEQVLNSVAFRKAPGLRHLLEHLITRSTEGLPLTAEETIVPQAPEPVFEETPPRQVMSFARPPQADKKPGADLMKTFSKQPLLFQPGTHWSYSSPGPGMR